MKGSVVFMDTTNALDPADIKRAKKYAEKIAFDQLNMHTSDTAKELTKIIAKKFPFFFNAGKKNKRLFFK